MDTFTKNQTSVHYTSNILRCEACNKKTSYVLDVLGNMIYCQQCFYNNLWKLLDNTEYIEVRRVETVFIEWKKMKAERDKMTYTLRYKILKRDNFKCVLCGGNDRLEIDHILPVSKWWKTIEKNLQTLCFPCNRGKSNS